MCMHRRHASTGTYVHKPCIYIQAMYVMHKPHTNYMHKFDMYLPCTNLIHAQTLNMHHTCIQVQMPNVSFCNMNTVEKEGLTIVWKSSSCVCTFSMFSSCHCALQSSFDSADVTFLQPILCDVVYCLQVKHNITKICQLVDALSPVIHMGLYQG